MCVYVYVCDVKQDIQRMQLFLYNIPTLRHYLSKSTFKEMFVCDVMSLND